MIQILIGGGLGESQHGGHFPAPGLTPCVLSKKEIFEFFQAALEAVMFSLRGEVTNPMKKSLHTVGNG